MAARNISQSQCLGAALVEECGPHRDPAAHSAYAQNAQNEPEQNASFTQLLIQK